MSAADLAASGLQTYDTSADNVGADYDHLPIVVDFRLTGARTLIWWYLACDVRKTGIPKEDPVEVIENLLVTPKELLELIHSGSFAVQGQIAAAYMALERLGYFTMTM